MRSTRVQRPENVISLPQTESPLRFWIPTGRSELDRLDSGQDAPRVRTPSGFQVTAATLGASTNRGTIHSKTAGVGLPIGVEHEQELTATDASPRH